MLQAYLNSGGAAAYAEAGDVSNDNPSATVLTANKVALVTATAKTVNSLTLPAGRWLVSAINHFVLAAASATKLESSISATTDTMGTQPGSGDIGAEGYTQVVIATTTATQENDQTLREVEVDLDAETTIYDVCKATFSAGAISVYGTIRAKRIG